MKTDRKPKVGPVPDELKTPKPRRASSRAASKTNGKHLLASYEHIPIGIVECSLDGRYMNVNEEFCRITGYKRQELLQLGIKDLTHEEDYLYDIHLHERLVTGRIPYYKIEKRLNCKDGGDVWVELTRSLVCDPQGAPLYTVGAVLDISDRKQVERVLRESVERLRLATESARMFMWEMDLQKQVYTLDDNFEKVLGFSGGLLPKGGLESLRDLIPAEDWQKLQDSITQAVGLHGDMHSLQSRLVNPETGESVWLEMNGKIVYDEQGIPVRMFGTTQNITQNKNIQDEITTISRLPQQNPDPVMRLTPQGGILYANNAALPLLRDWTTESGFSLPDELQQAVTAAMTSGEKTEVEIRHGERFYACTLAPILEAGHVNFYGKDVTARKEAEIARERSESNLWNFLENASVGIHWVDRDGIIIWANRAELDMLGYSRDEYIGRPIADFHAEQSTIHDILKRLSSGEALDNYEARLRHKDGSIRYGIINSNVLWENGEFIHTRCFTRDITERKQAEEKLRESEERFRAIVSQATAGIVESDLESRITFLNPGFCEMLGYTQDELLGKTIWELTYIEDVEQNKRLFDRMLREGKSYRFEKRFIRRDGSLLWTNVSVTSIHGPDGRPKGGVGVIIDIDERKRAEESLLEYARQQGALYRLSDELHRTETMTNVFDAVLDAILRALQCDRASILLLDETSVMRFTAWRGLSEAYRSATEGHSPWAPDAVDPRPVAMDDVHTADLHEPLRAVIEGEGIGALAFVPLLSNGRLIGKFMVYFNEPHHFTDEELDLSMTIAHQLAFAIGRRQSEQALRDSEERYRVVVESQVEMLCRFQLDGKILFVNGAYARARGTTAHELIDRNFWDFIPEHDQPAVRQLLEDLTPEAPEVQIENRFETTEGVRWTLWTNRALRFNEDGRVLEAQSSGIDITGRKRAEEAVRESEERFRHMADHAPVMIWMTDATGFCSYLSQSWYEFTGQTPESGLGYGWLKAVHPSDQDASEKLFHTSNKTRERFRMEYRLRDRDGTYRWAIDSAQPRFSESGEFLGYIGSVIDITDRKQIEEALRIENERFMRFVNSNIVGILIATADGRVVVANDYYLNLLGVSRQDLLEGKVDWRQFTPPEWLPADEKALRELNERGVCEPYEKEYVRADGTRVPVYLADALLPGPGNEIAAFVVDISERHQAEEALRASEERYRGIVNQTIGGIAETDPTGRFSMVNDRYCEITGYSRDELLNGMRLQDITHPDDMARNMEFFSRLIADGSPFEIEKRYVRPDGSTVWVHNSVSAILGADGRPQSAVAVVIDVTERRRTEEALRGSEALYRAIARNIPGGGVYIIDKDFRYVVAEGPVTEAFGLTPEILEGRTVSEVFTPDRAGPMEERLRRNFAGETVSFETRHNGRVYWTQQAPLLDSLGQAIILTVDITDRKQAEEALRESEERFSAILRQATAGIVRKDGEGRLVFVNEAFCTMLGYPEADLLGKTIWDFMHPEDITENRQSYHRLMSEGIPFKLERRLLRQDGSIIWVDASVSPIMDASGKPQSAVAVEVDITARRQAEDALQQLNLQLEDRVLSRTARLRQVNQTLREEITERKRAERALQESRERLQILSQRLVEVQEEERRAIARELHDRVGQTLAALNINLIIISGQLAGKLEEQVSARLSDSMKLVAETITLVRDVMSNLRPSVLDDYGLEAALQSHLSDFMSRYEIKVVMEKDETPLPRLGPSIEMTFLRIAQEALMNIAKHASATHVTLSLRQEQDAICMTIQDNGKGIQSWQEANRPGSHGLTIMRERAETFGGHLQVVSSPGNGTRIEVKIPRESHSPGRGQKETEL